MSGPEKISRERAKELTKQMIIEHSKEEFLKNGYLKVSVRSLAKSANLTSGAIYTHFKDKAELFESLVRPALLDLKTLLTEVHEERMEKIPAHGQQRSLGISLEKLKLMIGRIYDHITEFRLLMVSAAGSGQENFLRCISEYYSDCSEQYLHELKKEGKGHPSAEPEVIRLLSYSYFTAIFELVGRDMTRERAEISILPLYNFFQPGWEQLAS
jgi:AcrR family transcriptional regulator